MGPVARELLGEPNHAMSSAKELRFGKRGSISVDLEKGHLVRPRDARGRRRPRHDPQPHQHRDAMVRDRERFEMRRKYPCS
jgi:hypothetical protein